MEVFISWSGDVSRHIAELLAAFLEHVVKDVNTFISTQDIDAGDRWENRLTEQLDTSHHAIVCVTRENQRAPWLNYEAGALGKLLGRAKLIPYTIGFSPGELAIGPLSRFQGVQNDEAGTWKLVRTLNAAASRGRDDFFLKEGFTVWWPRLRDDMSRALMAAPTSATHPTPTDRELLLELRSDMQRLLDLTTRGTMDVGAAIDLLEVALRDSLTGLANRRAIVDRASQMVAAATPYILALIDIDSFKEVNDRFGHSVGDRLLAFVAARLRERLSSADIIARVAGDEFAVLFRNLTPQRVVETLTNVAAALRTEESGIPKFTISAGVTGDAVVSFEEKMQQAHKAILDAKKGGRNRIELA